MIIYHKNVDLFTTPDIMIVHGVNCQRVMGAGVAKLIKEKFPYAYEIYKETSPVLGEAKLIYCHNENDTKNSKLIVNLYTQLNYGNDNKKYVSYDAIDSCMKRLNHIMNVTGINACSMPKIGTGYGGGNWNVIETIINEQLKDKDINVYTLGE